MLRPMVGGLHRVEVFWENWVIRVKKMLRPGGLGIFFGMCECSTLPLFCIWGRLLRWLAKVFVKKQVSSINDQNDHLNDWFAQLRTKA
jgi:hypothetical protein